MDETRYRTDPAYRRMVEGARRGGRAKTPAKLEALERNRNKRGRPRAGLTMEETERIRWWVARGDIDPREADVMAQRLREMHRANDVLHAKGWSLEQERDFDDEDQVDVARVAEHLAETLDEGYAEAWRDWCETGKQWPPPPVVVLVRLADYRRTGRPGDRETGRPGDRWQVGGEQAPAEVDGFQL